MSQVFPYPITLVQRRSVIGQGKSCEKYARDRYGRAAGHYHASGKCISHSRFVLLYCGKQRHKLTEVIWLKYTQDICSLPKTCLFLPPRSIDSSAPHLEPQVHLLISFQASAGQEICQQTLACLDFAWQADSFSFFPLCFREAANGSQRLWSKELVKSDL